jgi:hypothetical protein
MKDITRKEIEPDELGENAYIRDHEGLSNDEGEEAGVFEGDGKMHPHKRDIKEGHGSTGSTMYDIDKNEIDTGTTGSNAKRDPNLEQPDYGRIHKR